MNRPIWGIVLLISVAMAGSGCSSESKSEPDAKSGQTAAGDNPIADLAATAAGAQSTHLLSENVPKRTSLEGRWVLLFFERMSGTEEPAALVEILKNPKDSKLRAIVKGFGTTLLNPRLRQASVTGNTVRLAVEMTVQTMSNGRPAGQGTKMLDILLELRDGIVRGSAQFDTLESVVVMMVPTELDNIQELKSQLLPEAADLQLPKESTPQQFLEKLVSFVHAHPDSPLTVEMYPIIFRGAGTLKMDAPTLEAEANKYAEAAERWSSRLGMKARIDAATGLVATGYLPEVSLKQIEICNSKLTEETIPVWKQLLEDLKLAATSNQAMTNIRSGTPEEKAKAAEVLKKQLELSPYNPIAVLELAQYDEQLGKKQEALHGYAQLAVLPMFDVVLNEAWKQAGEEHAPPLKTAQTLWKNLHGDKLDGLDAYLAEVYTKSMPKWKGKPVVPRAQQADNRVVLCELFTGTNCSYCVAADLAFAQVLETYKSSEVIALQYHEHIPQPDPLANGDTEQRFQFYFPERGGTPTFTISGAPAQAGGLLHQTDDVYKAIRGLIDNMLRRKTSVRIQLKAEPKDGVVAVTAEAEGSFAPTDPVRLRLVLAEEHVAVRGSNGIREHEMVVRAMPGGSGGVELKQGKLRYEGKVDLKVIRQQLDDYLRAYEEAQKTTFPAKPLDLSHLHLVAFVQNDQTKEIYQAATIPFPSGPAPAAAAKSQASVEQPKPSANAVSKASP
jgi:hypothetical protein